MFLSRRKLSTVPVVHLDVTTLETRPCADYLGVCIDYQLSWKEQVKKITGSAYGALRQVKHSLPLHTRKLLYRVLVLPILEYCTVFRDPSTAILKTKLERVQNYAACLILDKPPWTSSEELWNALNWQTLEERRCFQHAKLTYRILNKQSTSCTTWGS